MMNAFNNQNGGQEKQEGILNFGVRQSRLQEIIYRSLITDYDLLRDCPTKYGLRDRVIIHFTVFLEETQSTEVVKQSYLSSNYPGSMFDNLVVELFDRHVGRTFDLKELKGKECLVKIKYYTNEQGDTFDNVEYVKKVDQPLTGGTL